jgi:hypothetical protein
VFQVEADGQRWSAASSAGMLGAAELAVVGAEHLSFSRSGVADPHHVEPGQGGDNDTAVRREAEPVDIEAIPALQGGDITDRAQVGQHGEQFLLGRGNGGSGQAACPKR